MVDLSNAYLCMQCHTCSAACTAAPVNGLRPREIVLRAARGDPTLLEDADVPWLCVTCYSYTEQCRAGIDVTELFYRLRENAAERGHIPAPYRAVAGAVTTGGRHQAGLRKNRSGKATSRGAGCHRRRSRRRRRRGGAGRCADAPR